MHYLQLLNMEGRYAKLHLRIKAMLPDLHYHSFARARTYKEKIVQLPDTWKAAVRFFNTAGHPLLHSTALFCLLAKVSTVSSSPDSMLLSLLLKLDPLQFPVHVNSPASTSEIVLQTSLPSTLVDALHKRR